MQSHYTVTGLIATIKSMVIKNNFFNTPLNTITSNNLFYTHLLVSLKTVTSNNLFNTYLLTTLNTVTSKILFYTHLLVILKTVASNNLFYTYLLATIFSTFPQRQPFLQHATINNHLVSTFTNNHPRYHLFNMPPLATTLSALLLTIIPKTLTSNELFNTLNNNDL